ncbi:visual pigment-like receptor peropsin [Montipora capricornis]|uniref:visual pigment-like receptor peropsin n=1 Tax=Montipora capricornis TaxID=246305 RepID=UPI0035F18E0A
MNEISTAFTTTAQIVSDSSDNPNSARRPDQVGLIFYVLVMTIILIVGFAGNLFTILVLRCPEHKNKIITPLMINLSFADIIIIVFGYPVVVASNFTEHNVLKNRSLCVWSGFINGSVGIASIANLTMMSLVMFKNFNKVGTARRVPWKQMLVMILFTWVYGAAAMVPPLVGWNKFVPGASGISCCPNWSPDTTAAVAYNVLLVFVGFVFPLTVIIVCYYRIYRFIHTQHPVTGNASIEASRKRSEIKIVRMIAMAIAAFVLSWSPYCFVSIAGTIRGSALLTAGEAEVPDLLAKASVIYNPIVYTVMNHRFRKTLLRIIPCRRWFHGDINPAVSDSAQNSQEPNSHIGGRPPKAKESSV